MNNTYTLLGLLPLAIGLAVGSPPAFAQGTENVTQLIRDSQAALAAENLDEAVRLARRAVELDPAHPPAWRQHGLALLRGGKAGEAATALQRAVAMDDRDATAWRGLAMAQWQSTQQNEAVRALSAYLRLKPEDAPVWRDLAAWLAKLERSEQCVAALERVVELRPDDTSAWRDLAAWLTRLERADEAIAAWKRVVALTPDDAPAWRAMAALHQRQKRLPEAAKAYEQALAVRPDDAATRRDLGWVLWTLGRRDEAVVHLTEALESGIDARERVIYQVVARLSEEGADAEALAFLRRATPDSPPSELGLELARAGRLKAAEPVLASAWRTGEKTPDIGLYLAYARAVNGQFADIAAHLEPLLGAADALSPERADLALEVLRLGGKRPETPALAERLESVLDKKARHVERITEILETAAETYRVRGEPEQALQLYRRVLDRDPNRASWIWAVLLAERVEGQTPYAWLNDHGRRVTLPARQAGVKGLRAHRRGNADEAIPELRKSLSLDAQQPPLRQLLFRSLLEAGRLAEARAETEWVARQVDAGEGTLRSYLAEMLTRLGDTEKALGHWQLLHASYPEQPYYGIETARALYRLGRPDEAVDVLQAMVENTPDPRIIELLAEIASARGHKAAAVEWAARGLAVTPSQGLLRYHAENLDALGTNAPAALASALSFLEHDPGYVPLTLLAARLLDASPPELDSRSIPARPTGAEAFHSALLARNPAFVPSLAALRDLTTREGRIDEAVEHARVRATVQPDNAEAQRQYANSLAQQDRFGKALDILRPLARTPLEAAVPVLVYPSIALSPYAGRNSVAQISDHIRQLAGDGVVFVNSFGQLDETPNTRRVMVVLVDPEAAVVEALDPVLQQYKARVVVVGNAGNPALSQSGEPRSEAAAALLATARWQLASGGPIGLERGVVNPAGVLGSPLTHPVMVDGAIEDAAAFAARLDRALAKSVGTLAQHGERILVYPAGDFGQRSLDTAPEHLATLHTAVAKHFTHALYFDDSGFYVVDPKTDPLRVPARSVPPEWDAAALATYLGSGHPLVRARLELARVLYWHGQHEEAHAAFADAEAAGADRVDTLFNWGLNADRQGDIPTAVAKLRQARELDSESERIQHAVERAEERRRPQVRAGLQGWEDNEDRSYFQFGAVGDLFVADRLRLGAAADRNRWKTDGLGREYGTRLGLRSQWYLAEQAWLAGRVWNLDLDELSDRWGGDIALRLPNPLLSGFMTLMATREEIETVEALRADVDSQLYALRTYTRLLDTFDLFTDLSRNDRTDGNDTTMLEGRLLYRVKEWPYAGVGWRFRLADSDVDPADYWAPEELEQHQLHLNLRGVWGRLSGTLSGDAGYAREQDTDWRFVWGTRVEGELRLSGSLAITAQLGWFEGPEYERLHGGIGLTGRF